MEGRDVEEGVKDRQRALQLMSYLQKELRRELQFI